MHLIDFILDANSNIFFNNSLSNIDNLDLTYLYLEI